MFSRYSVSGVRGYGPRVSMFTGWRVDVFPRKLNLKDVKFLGGSLMACLRVKLKAT